MEIKFFISFHCFLFFFLFYCPANISLASTDVTKKQYELVEKKLDYFIDLDIERKVNCSVTDEIFWKDWSYEWIDLKGIPLKNVTERGIEAEKWMLKNSLIKLAHARLYLAYLQQSKKVDSKLALPWLTLAASASHMVGQLIQYYYLKFKMEDQSGSIRPELKFNRLSLLKTYLAKKGLKKRKTQKGIAEANFYIYGEFQWQMLAYIKCGVETIKRISKDSRHTDYYKIWSLIGRGDSKSIEKANYLIIDIEQRRFLQKLLYSKKSAVIANFLGIMNFHTKVKFRDINGKYLNNFPKYCRKKIRYPQLSDSKLRYDWMIYILNRHWPYLESQKQKEISYKDHYHLLKDTYDILYDYHVVN